MGGQVRRFGPQTNIKFRYALESLLQIGYSGIGLGTHDLQLDTDAVLYVLANLDPENNPLVSANVALFGFESGFSSRYRVIEAGQQRLGVTSVLGKDFQAEMAKISDVTWLDPVEALDEVAPKMVDESCDWQVLMVHGDQEEAAELGRRYPQFQLVATTGGAEEPPSRAQSIEGTDTRLIVVGHKGMYVIAVGLYTAANKEHALPARAAGHSVCRFARDAGKAGCVPAGTGNVGPGRVGINGSEQPRGSIRGFSHLR